MISAQLPIAKSKPNVADIEQVSGSISSQHSEIEKSPPRPITDPDPPQYTLLNFQTNSTRIKDKINELYRQEKKFVYARQQTKQKLLHETNVIFNLERCHQTKLPKVNDNKPATVEGLVLISS